MCQDRLVSPIAARPRRRTFESTRIGEREALVILVHHHRDALAGLPLHRKQVGNTAQIGKGESQPERIGNVTTPNALSPVAEDFSQNAVQLGCVKYRHRLCIPVEVVTAEKIAKADSVYPKFKQGISVAAWR